MKLKRRVAIIIAVALIFTTSFSMGVSYATEEYEEDFNLIMEFIPGYTWSTWPSLDGDDFAQAKTDEGVVIEMPYGYITDRSGGEYEPFVSVFASIPYDSDIIDLDMPSEIDEDGETYYSEEVYLNDVAVDGAFTYVIKATLYDDEVVTYTFHFVEDEGDSLEITYFYATYYDDNGNEDSVLLIEQEDLASFQGAVTLTLPYYYDNSEGITFDCRGLNCIIDGAFEETYYLDDAGQATFDFTFKSANGKNQVTIPIHVSRDTDGSKAELEEIEVNVWEYFDDDTYVDEYFYADISDMNCMNEFYVMIPSYYDCYYSEDDSYWGSVDFEYISNVSLYAKGKDGARFKITYEEDGEEWEEVWTSFYQDLEDFQYEDVVEQEVPLKVYSPNDKNVNEYTVKVIVSDCDGYHRYSSWKVIQEASAVEKGIKMHKCLDCPYKEYKEIPMTDELSAPAIKIENVASSGKIKLSWNAVPGAEEYVIQRSVGNDDNYVAYKTTTSTSFTNTAVTAGKTYYYRVKAVGAGYESDWAYEYQTCDLARPEISISNVASSGAIKLSWKAVEGADRYEIQRSVGNDDNYVAYKTTTSTSFTNTATTAGKTYYYRVRAIYDGKSSANSAWGYEYQTCDLARPEVSISNVASSGKIKLSWKAVEGADRYEIQRSVGNDDNYVAYKTTTSTSFTNTATTAGTTYYYRVRAIYDGKSSANSAWGSEYQTCDLAAPVITVSGTKNPGKIVVSWSKVSGADRYYIYRATSKTGTYSKYSSTTSTTWTNNDVVKGKTYYYKVKAIYDDNTVANSAYSNMDYAYVR